MNKKFSDEDLWKPGENSLSTGVIAHAAVKRDQRLAKEGELTDFLRVQPVLSAEEATKRDLFDLRNDLSEHRYKLLEPSHEHDFSGKILSAVEKRMEKPDQPIHVDLSRTYTMDQQDAGDDRQARSVNRVAPFIARAQQLGITVDTGGALLDGGIRYDNRKDDNLLKMETFARQNRQEFEPNLLAAHRQGYQYVEDHNEKYHEMRNHHVAVMAEMDKRGLKAPTEEIELEKLSKMDATDLKRQAVIATSRIMAEQRKFESVAGVPSLEQDMASRRVELIRQIETDPQKQVELTAFRPVSSLFQKVDNWFIDEPEVPLPAATLENRQESNAGVPKINQKLLN